MYKMTVWLAAMLILQVPCYAQSKWSGGAGDGLWQTPANWMPGLAPRVAPWEDVLLDNSLYPGNYTVKIMTSDSVAIHSLVIAPAEGKSITLIIDSSSKVSTALTVTSNEQGIVISKGGGIINSSGAGDGVVISLTDSLRIENGGFYSHQTRRAHAALASRLSRSTGTEQGVFEFNIPSAGNTLSLANQHYGTLRLSSLRYGNNCTYSGSATSPLNIRGDLELGPGVTWALNFSDTISIKGNYLQSGGSFNMASSTRSSTVVVYGDLIQSSGIITKTGAAIPSLVLSGNTMQQLSLAGGIAGNITLKINNAKGVQLLTPVIISSVLELSKGRVSTSLTNLLTLTAGAKVIADSTSHAAFIDGPLRKEGLSAADHFLFPVGKNSIHRWLCIKNVTGNFIVEYHRSNPHLISSVLQPGIDHISTMEHWSVEADALPLASGKIMLSYDENSSGGVSDLSTLRVAVCMNEHSWIDGGNESTTGSAGSSGAVLSALFSPLSAGAKFTLAGSVPVQNPLPVRLVSFTAIRKKEYVSLSWQINSDHPASHFDVEASQDGYLFTVLSNMQASAGRNKYEFNDRQAFSSSFYRLKITDKWGASFYSKARRVDDSPGQWQLNTVRIQPGSVLECILQSEKEKVLKLELFDMTARRILFTQQNIIPGNNVLRFNPIYLPGGGYILRVSDQENVIKILRFIK